MKMKKLLPLLMVLALVWSSQILTAQTLVYDDSDGPFTILAKTVTVLAPNGGESWTVGSSHNITWTSTGTIANVNIDYSIDNGSSWSPVAATIANNGTCAWTMPASISTTCLVRVSDAANAATYDVSNGAFTIAAIPTLTVTSPNGSESWQAGSQHDITWTANFTGSVSIDLYKGGSFHSSIGIALAETGKVTWTISTTISAAADYKIRVYQGTAEDYSDNNFTIMASPPPTITLTSPNGGEVLNAGTAENITWTSTDLSPDELLNLEYSTDSGSTWSAAGQSRNDGGMIWTVPLKPSVLCLVRVTRIASPQVSDVSNSPFSIVGTSITVMAPTAGTKWQRGVVHTITWTKTGALNANVKIRLYKGTVLSLTIVSTTANDGSFNWKIPASLVLANNYKIRVNTVDNLVTGDSGVFSITNTAGLTLQTPNGKERLAAQAVVPINWTVDPSVSEVKLEYSRDNGGTFFIIADHLPNNGQYAWRVPVNFTSNGIIRVSDSHGKNWLDQEGVFECMFKFNGNSQEGARQPDFAVWFGPAHVKAPGYGFARVAISRDMIQMAEVSRSIEPLSSGWHEVKIRLDLKRDLGTLFIDNERLLENVALYTSPEQHFAPYISLRAGSGGLLLSDLTVQVTLLSADGNEKDSFTILTDDFSGYDGKRNVIGSCWQVRGIMPDKPTLKFKALPGMGQALWLQSAAGAPITITKPLAIPEKMPFDISDRSFIIEMR